MNRTNRDDKGKQLGLALPRVKGRAVRVDFDGGEVSSDGGLLAVREADRRLGLTERVARLMRDVRRGPGVDHRVLTMLRQRVYGLCAGWEDLNDAQVLRHDRLLQTLAGSDEALASAPTLCRLEQWQDRQSARAVNQLLVDLFLDSFPSPPEELILDFDATDDRVHGTQEGRAFHGYYGDYCFLPLYVFCGDALLVAYLRRSDQDAAAHSAAILKLLVTAIRKRYPDTRIVFRADSGFCRDRTLIWCDRHGVDYCVGLAKNEVLLRESEAYREEARRLYEETGDKQRLFGGLIYGAKGWRLKRHVICKAEHTEKGANPRFVVTSLIRDEAEVYDRIYCARGEMENRIKEQMQLFSDRTSSTRWWTNQWRMILSALAYTLLQYLRSACLRGTRLAKAQMATLRTQLIKIGAIVTRNTHTVRVHLSSAYPLRELFAELMRRLRPG